MSDITHFFAVARRRALRARSSRNASASTRSGGSRRSWSASRTSRRRARRERTSGRTSATRQDWRPTLGSHEVQNHIMLLSGVREEGLREEEHLQDSRERQGARGHRHLRRRREGHDGVRHQDQAQQESLRSLTRSTRFCTRWPGRSDANSNNCPCLVSHKQIFDNAHVSPCRRG